MSRQDARNGLLCAAAVIAAFFVVGPWASMPFDDDWSYSFTVRRFLETGHFFYNGWSAPVIITHVLWGALFARIFGYSFVTLRFSTLPFAAACGFFCYLLARRAQLRPGAAILTALVLGLSPLFLPLAASFMTDVPALGYMLISLYAFVLAAESKEPGRAINWLVAGAIVAILGGMNRQTVWIVPLCVIPYLMILRRRDLGFIVAGILAYASVLLDITLTLAWFRRQPWVYLDPPLIDCVRRGLQNPGVTLADIIMVVFTVVMFTLPAMIPFCAESLARLWRERRNWRGAITALIVLVLAVAVSVKPAFGMGPWLYNIVSTKGVVGALELSGRRPTTLPLAARGIISALVLMTCYLLAARAVILFLEPRRSWIRLRQFFSGPSAAPILAIFAIAYFSVMILRSGQDQVFDRYCLPLIPCLAILMLRAAPAKSPAIWTFAWVLLAVYAFYGVAVTHDNLALAAARRAAIDRLESHGVPRTEIAGGFEYDFYTQLQERGHINRYGITNPPNAFDPLQYYTPALKCRYRLEYPRLAGMEPSRFGQIEYICWLPPFRRVVCIDRFENPWWFDARAAHRAPVPLNFEVDYEE